MNDSALRALFGRTGSGTTISMSDGWGRSNVSVSLSQLQSRTFYVSQGGYNVQQYRFFSNGTWDLYDYSGQTPATGGNWASPTTSSIGNNYWIRFTRTAGSGLNLGSSTATTGWLALSSQQNITLTHNGYSGGYIDSTYNIDISSDSGGSNIVASCTGTYIYSFNEY
jgi:hypothetical protein